MIEGRNTSLIENWLPNFSSSYDSFYSIMKKLGCVHKIIQTELVFLSLELDQAEKNDTAVYAWHIMFCALQSSHYALCVMHVLWN